MLNFIRSTLFAVFIIPAFVCLPAVSFAGALDFMKGAALWWSARTIIEGTGASDEGAVQDEDPPAGNDARGETSRSPGMCRVPQEPPVNACELGSGFICVNTPPGGVAGDTLRIKGTIDRQGSVLASIRIAVQNEYTKALQYIDTSSPATTGCWDEVVPARPFCLDPAGFFSAMVILPDVGPYTIAVSASRVSGRSEERRVRVSRVRPLELDGDDLTFDPDVRLSPETDGQVVTVTAKLIGDCSFCDFIGASTGGVRVSVENVIRDDTGASRRITCSTTVEQGGAGRFVIGVPVGPGENSLTVRACNAAFTEGNCPSVDGINFRGQGRLTSFNIISPPPAPAYDSDKYPVIPLSFSLAGNGPCALLQFNREALRQVCSNSDGVYSVELAPRVGINVLSVTQLDTDKQFAWTFGWGKILSPFGNNKGHIAVPGALSLVIQPSTIEEIAVPLINNSLASDEFGAFLSSIDVQMGGGTSSKGASLRALIPGCGDEEGFGDFRIAMRGSPKIEGAKIDHVKLGGGGLDFRAVLGGVEIGIDLVSERDSLPLTIAFRKAIADISIAEGRGTDGGTTLLVTSPHDDCEFKRESYCKHLPAPLIPQNFVGGATPWGGFVRCEEAEARGGAGDVCAAINSLNAQTGVVSEKVLDAINSAIYCGGSALLTGLLREGIHLDGPRIGCGGSGVCEGALGRLLPALSLPMELRIEDVGLSGRGISISAEFGVGNAGVFEQTPAVTKIPESGLIVDAVGGPLAAPSAGGSDVAVSISLDFANAILFTAVAQGDGRTSRGLLDFDIHEKLFAGLGFDFVSECDAFEPIPGEKEKLPTLCHIRPRVEELLGSSLSTYGYFRSKQPLLLSTRGNRALAPRIDLVRLEDLPVVVRGAESISSEDGGDSYVPAGDLLELQLGGLMLSFYALEVDADSPPDKYGNLPARFDADGEPLIYTMRPEDPDPWNGPIISVDATILVGLELGAIEQDPNDESEFRIAVRTLADRSRVVLTPVTGSNATTVPPEGLISAFNEKLNLAIAGFSSAEGAMHINIPKEFAFTAREDGSFGLLGLKEISFGPDGISLDYNPQLDVVTVALEFMLTQLLHEGGNETESLLSSN